MRGDGRAAASAVWQENLTEKLIEELAVIGVNFAFFLERDGCGFAVSALNQTDFGFQRGESFDIGLAAAKICLDGNAGIAVVSLHLFENVQSSARIGGAFHVDLNAFLHGRSSRSDFLRQGKAQLAIEIEPELRQFYGDISVDARLGEGAEDLYITLGGLSGFVGGGDVFAQMVQDDGLADARKWSDSLERFVQRFAGDESSRKAVPRSQAPDPMGHVFLGGEPEDQIA